MHISVAAGIQVGRLIMSKHLSDCGFKVCAQAYKPVVTACTMIFTRNHNTSLHKPVGIVHVYCIHVCIHSYILGLLTTTAVFC